MFAITSPNYVGLYNDFIVNYVFRVLTKIVPKSWSSIYANM